MRRHPRPTHGHLIPRDRYGLALRRTLRTTAAAYGYTLMITMTTATLTSLQGSPSVGEAVLFATGGLLAFVVLEGMLSTIPGSRKRDPPEATAFVGVLNVASIGGGLAVAIGLAELVDAWIAWLLAPLVGTVVYMLLVSAQIAVIEEHKS